MTRSLLLSLILVNNMSANEEVNENHVGLGSPEVEDTGIIYETTDTDHVNARLLKSLQTGPLPVQSTNPDPSDEDPDGEWN